MDIGRGRIVCLVVIISIIVHCVASDSQVCRAEERMDMGLSKIQDPAQIISVGYASQSAPDCYDSCCNVTGNQCNAVSFYDKEKLCMLLNCRPFSNCVWVAADGFMAARIKMTSVADDPLPPPPPIPPSISDPMASSTTSHKPMEFTTTIQTTTTTTTTPNTSGKLETNTPQPQNPDTSFNSGQASVSFDSTTNSSEVSDWNMNNEDDNMSVEATPIELLPTVKPEQKSEQTAAPAFQDEGEGSNARPKEMKRMFFQSPGIIIGLCSALGVAFLVLLAVCRKVYLSHDRPRYKPLRDYDIRFEPPAASSALLP